MNGLFAQIPGTRQESAPGETRSFKGDGTSFLQVPGLVKVEAVRVGIANVPLTTPMTFPATGKPGSFVEAEWPTVSIQEDAESVPVLLRASFSNDGIWQKDATIYITGEWKKDEAPAKSKPKPATGENGDGTPAGTN